MPKKGKGRSKGRGEPPQIPGLTLPVQQPQRDAPAPRGRGRGRGEPTQRSPGSTSPGTSQQKDTSKESGEGSSQTFFTSPVPESGGAKPKKDVSKVKEEYPELSATSGVTASSQDIPGQRKVVTKAEQQELLSKVSGLTLEHKVPEPKHMPLAKRPNYAAILDRNRISLFINYFKLDFKDTTIYHYDIDIYDSTKDNKIGKSVFSQGRTAKEDIKKGVKHVEREKRRNMGKAKCREIISKTFNSTESLRQYCPVYDGQKNLFTSKKLPIKKDPYPVDIEVDGKRKRFFIAITPVVKEDKTNIIDLEPLKELYSNRSREIPYEVLLVFETVMNHREPPFTQVQFRSSFFNLHDRKDPLGCGLDIWFGYHQSIHLTKLGPVVVINLAAKAFHKSGPVIDYASDVLEADITRLPKLQHYQINKLNESLKGVQVKVTHQPNPRKYKIKAVTSDGARDIMLQDTRKSVAQYFLERYNKKLLYPHLPCLQMQSNTATFIPMETCVVVEGQPKIGKLNAELTSKMIRGTAVPPQRRMDDIKRKAAGVNEISRRFMQAFGLLMNVQLLKVDGRIITAPMLAYGGDERDKSRIAKPDNKGVWRIEDGKKFFQVVEVNDKWVLISFADDRRVGRPVLEKYCQFLVTSARKCGIRLDRPLSIDICGRNVKTEDAIIKAKRCGAKFAIVVLNRRDNYHSYDEVKFLADFKHNLVTQCMEDKTLSRINDQITTNVCLKINVKLGGINHILLHKPQIFSQPVIVLGIDAIHWPRGYGYPSILSVVGSLNPTASRYALVCDLQRNEKHEKISQEIIRKMDTFVKEILHIFTTTNNGRYPHKILVFRDGVSEGQFQHAVDYEVGGIQEACRQLYGKEIPITYLVVQKRHQTRLFPANPSQGVGRNQNVPPGTCVDKDITHPVFFDYFICSHEGIQGTSKPAHYTVLHDDNGFKSEELQELCYFLCHTYVRCTRSVSLPAPVMYADLAAARAKKYADLKISSDTMSVSSDDTQRDLPPEVERAIRSMKSFSNNMFYV